jgi:hypothetical protein
MKLTFNTSQLMNIILIVIFETGLKHLTNQKSLTLSHQALFYV